MTNDLVSVPSATLKFTEVKIMTGQSIQVQNDDMRDVRESQIRTEGMVKDTQNQVSKIDFRLDSHDQRIGALEKDNIRDEGRRQGREAVTKKVDKMALAIIGAIGTVAGACLVAIAHKFGFA